MPSGSMPSASASARVVAPEAPSLALFLEPLGRPFRLGAAAAGAAATDAVHN